LEGEMSIHINVLRDIAQSGWAVCDEAADEIEQLERELAAAKAELAEYERTVAHMRDGARLQDSATAAVLERAEKAEAELAACREDAEKALKALEAMQMEARARNCGLKICDDAIDEIREALDAARKEGA